MVNNNKMKFIPVTQIQTPNLDDQMILLRACSLTKNWKKSFVNIFILQKSSITPWKEAIIG